jgi:4'-phosphopantetheinyl transferase
MGGLTTPNWDNVPTPPSLADDEIHIWQIPLTRQHCHAEYLSRAEHQRWRGFTDPGLARRFCAARSILRSLLAAYTGTSPARVELQISRHGKPHLAAPSEAIHFNLSHSGDWGLIAVCRSTEVGVDLEWLRDIPNREKVARRVMEESDLRELEDADFSQAVFTRLWTRMEARQKCVGQGVFGERVEASGVGLHSFNAGSGFIGSLAWSDRDFRPVLGFFHYS